MGREDGENEALTGQPIWGGIKDVTARSWEHYSLVFLGWGEEDAVLTPEPKAGLVTEDAREHWYPRAV